MPLLSVELRLRKRSFARYTETRVEEHATKTSFIFDELLDRLRHERFINSDRSIQRPFMRLHPIMEQATEAKAFAA
jgi:hypothetical protein